MKLLVRITAALLTIACALYPLTIVTDPIGLAALGGLAVVAVGLALVTSEWVLAGPGVSLVILEYTIALADSSAPFDWRAPALAVGCLVVLELVDTAPVFRRDTEEGRAVSANHLRRTVLVVLVASLTALATASTAGLLHGGPTPLLVGAAFCGAIAVAALMSLTRARIARPEP